MATENSELDEDRSRGSNIRWIIIGAVVPISVALIQVFGPQALQIKRYFPSNSETSVPLSEGHDFVSTASSAMWSNGNETLRFPGARSDRRGYVYYASLEHGPLENGEEVNEFLVTHPEWKPFGIIRGKYGPFLISEDLRIEARVGFRSPGLQSDGVNFSILFKPINEDQEVQLASVQEHPDGGLTRLVANLAPLQGREGFIILQASAGNSSAQDWAVWTLARVVPR